MNKICLMQWSDSNIAGYEWSWKVTLTFLKNKKFSIGAKQTTREPPTFFLPSIYPLNNGKEVKEAIEILFKDDNLSDVEIDWDSIITVIRKHALNLADEINQCLRSEITRETEFEINEQRKRVEDRPIYDWVDRAILEKGVERRDPWGIERSRKKLAALQYVRSYLNENGIFPTGNHQIDEIVQPSPIYASSSRVCFKINFPPSQDELKTISKAGVLKRIL